MFGKLFGFQKDESNLNPEQFRRRMSERGMILIDVRTSQEFQGGHIPGAVNIDFYKNFESKIKKMDKSKTYLLYCRSGNRSGTAVKMMKKLGFKDVSHLQKGILSWKEKLTF